MKGSCVIGALALLLANGINFNSSHAQTAGYVVAERGPDFKVLQRTTVEHGTNRIGRYTELATGMNYTNSYGQLTEAKEQITLLPTGGAAATEGRHKVYFPADIYNGVIEVVTPDGRHLKSHPLGVSYDDGSNTVFIATLKHAQGYLTSSNTVTYRDAFNEFKADIVATYRRGGFECDLVFRQQPPTPDQFGLDNSFATLQMVTEFFNTQDPQEIPAQSDDWFGLQDSTLKFGKLTMTHGKAFAIKPDSQLPATNSQATVYKSWVHAQGRTFLIESVPVLDIADNLDALPLSASAANPKSTIPHLALGRSVFPPAHEFVADTNQILIASTDYNKQPGVVLDYNEVTDSFLQDYTFRAGQTYYISAPVELSGVTTFEGGTILKFDNGSLKTPILDAYSYMVWPTNTDNPVCFTGANDDSVGDIIPNGSGAGTFICCYWENFPVWEDRPVRNARFLNASGAALVVDCAATVLNSGDYAMINVWHSRFEGCAQGICLVNGYDYMGEISFYNVLFHGGANLVGGEVLPDVEAFAVNCVNVTLGNYNLPVSASGASTGYTLSMTNCIWLEGLWFGLNSFPRDHCYITATYGETTTYPSIPEDEFFKAGGSSAYYLGDMAHACTGTANINSELLAELQTMTTYAPQDGGWPDTNALDIGYHYPVNEDSDHDGLPDWWEWHWFASYSLSGTNIDGYYSTLLTDYQYGFDPNVIFYSLVAERNYVTNGITTLGTPIDSGFPAYYAVLVDNTNLNTVSWTAYAGTSVPVNLGNTEGWHKVWVGLKGPAAEATVTWQYKQLCLDKTPPRVSLTSPTNFVVMQPMVQLSGFSPEPLASLSYELTNSAGLMANGHVLILRQFYDINTASFSTNYFQAFDVDLVTGSNCFTLRATDEAGNVTVTNFTFKLDYSGKTNATVQVAWPAAGMAVSGTNFTLYGFVDDPTVMMQAFITDTNGTTNMVSGMVERTGRFWVDDLPLNGGTNKVSIVVSNAIGQLTVTNFTVTQSSLNVTVDDLTDNAQLWQPTMSLRGTVSDPAAMVTVNGITAVNNGDGSWNAEAVPTTAGGVAIFNAAVSGAGGASGNTLSGPEKPARVYVSEDHLSDNSYGYEASVPDVGVFSGLWKNYHYDVYESPTQTRPNGGGANSAFSYPPNGGSSSADYQLIYPAIGEEGVSIWLNAPAWMDPRPVTNATLVARPAVWRHVATGWQMSANNFFISENNWNADAAANYHNKMGADTVIHLQTGGRSGSKRQNLFCLSGSATAYKNWPWPYFEPLPTPDEMPGVPDRAVSFGQIQMNGLSLGNDGNRWLVLPDDQDLDITPKVKNNDYYTFTAGAQKYRLQILANGYPLSDNRVRSQAHYVVGEYIGFDQTFTPSLPEMPQYSPIQWALDGTYVNDSRAPAYSDGSTIYQVSPSKLTTKATSAWWYDGEYNPTTQLKATLGEGLTFANGQYVAIATHGLFTMHRPRLVNYNQSPIGMCIEHWHDFGQSPIYMAPVQDVLTVAPSAKYTLAIDSISPFDGVGMPTQVLSGYQTNSHVILGVGFGMDTHGDTYLDNSEDYYNAYNLGNPYGSVVAGNISESGFFFIDTPAITCYENTAQQLAFKDYIRFRPWAGPGPNIFVTLGTVSWHSRADTHLSPVPGTNVQDYVPFRSITADPPDFVPTGDANFDTGLIDDNLFPYWVHTAHNH